MNIGIYLGIVVLFAVLILWTWNNSKEFETKTQRVTFIIIGIVILWFITYIIFNISKTGINYPNKEIVGEVRRIILLVFVPINGFFTLPHIANFLAKIKNNEAINKRMLIYVVIFIVAIIIEVFYLKDFQTGLLEFINRK